MTTLAQFKEGVAAAQPPQALGPALDALWWAAKGDWDKAHKIVMDDDGRDAAWVHAYLHRVEGDLPNAGYWYRTAGKPDVVDPLYDFNVRGCRLRGRPWPSVSRFAVARNNKWAIPVLPNWPRMEELVRCSRLSRSSALYRIASRHRMAGDSFPQRMR